MLETLTIKNFGIIEQTSLEFTKGLNTLTGETGAGKSILIDALRFALGGRFQNSYLRSGANTCTVEAVFSLNSGFLRTLPNWEDFKNDDDTFIIQRSITTDGRNKARINGLTTTVAQLKEIGDKLIDFHGPNDHQQLLAENQHRVIIDALTNFNTDLEKYSALFKQYSSIQMKLNNLRELAHSRERDTGLLAHQIKELEQVPLNEDALAELERDRVKINNAEKLYTHISQAMSIIENDETSLESLLSKTFKPLQNLSDIDNNASTLLNNLSTLQDQANTLLNDMRNYADSLSFDHSFAESVNSRYDAYHDIQRKYGPTLNDARQFYNNAKEKFALLNDFEHNQEDLQAELKDTQNLLNKLATAITQKRKKTSELLKKTIEQELQELAFKSISFEASLEKIPLSPSGADKVVFYISTNTGEGLKPLADIVSSGEAARLMLAIKRALMKVDPVPVLIFDEVDAQIGGRLGTVIGTKLKEVAQYRQVILITHLPQIAAFADTHFRITKDIDNGRTRTLVVKLNENDRVNELAHMMSGDKMTAVSIRHANDMLDEAKRNF